MSTLLELILDALEKRGEVRHEGKGWRTRCPNPGHEDRNPSFFLYPGGGGRCFSQCGRYWPPEELAALLGITLPRTRAGLTVAQLAEAKGLPEDFLRSFGVADGVVGGPGERLPCVDIPYADTSGTVVAIHKRLSLEGDARFRWRRDDRPTLYGLAHLADIRRSRAVVLVEGETDCWTLWMHRIPALGLPGASTWREEFASLLHGLEVYLWHEPNGGGDTLLGSVVEDLPDLRVIEPPPGVKDPSELFLQNPEGFKARMEALTKEARPFRQLRMEALSAEARECLDKAQALLDDPQLLRRLEQVLRAGGHAGDGRPALMAYIAITSRLLPKPLHLAYISQSASGKNAAIEAILPYFPEGASYLVRAASPRALVYNEEAFDHRTVIMTEADSLPEDGPAASAIRSLMSDGEMLYEVVEKGADGKFRTRKIEKPGPTGLITTSIKPLGDQATTRTLTVPIPDSKERSRLILHAQADRVNDDLPLQDPSPWAALQRWLELAGDRAVFIPYANALADLLPVTAARIHRDFPQLLTVIQSIALLHQKLRPRDDRGRIVATLEDYEEARWLLEEVFAATASEGVTATIRETVQKVAELTQGGKVVSEAAVAKVLGLSRSSVHYRVDRAIKGGWLVNRSLVRGSPAQLAIGEPLPDACALPLVERVCAEHPQNPSNIRTVPAGESVGNRSNPHSNAPGLFEPSADHSNAHSNSPEPVGTPLFEPFGPNSGAPHTQAQDTTDVRFEEGTL